MQICRCAQIGQARIGSLLAKVLGNSIHSQGNLDVKCTIQVCVASDSKRLALVQIQKPIANHWGMSEQIATSTGIQFIICL